MKRGTALGLIGASMLDGGGVARADGLPVVRIGSAIADDLTPALYAMQAGLFQKAGIQVQLQVAQSGAVLAAAVAGGAVDIAKSTLMALIAAYTHGVRFKIVAGAAVFSAKAPTGELVVPIDGIKSLADAGGKTIAISALRQLDHLATLRLIDQSGGNSATVKFIELPYSAMLLALESGHADIASISNPTLQAALDSGKVRALADPYEALGQRFMIAGWFCTAQYLASNADTVRRFASAMHDAVVYTNAHPAETVGLIADYTHIDPDTVKRMNRLQSAPTIDVGDIQMLIDSAYKYKFIDSTFSAKELVG